MSRPPALAMAVLAFCAVLLFVSGFEMLSPASADTVTHGHCPLHGSPGLVESDASAPHVPSTRLCCAPRQSDPGPFQPHAIFVPPRV